MTLDLAKLRALAAAATPGPWKAHDSHGLYVASHDAIHEPDDEFECVADLSPDHSVRGWHGIPADAAFIAAARTAIPELLDEVERLRQSLRYLRRKIDGYDGTFEACGFEEFKETP